MSDCTVSDVLTDAMSLLGDPNGEITQEIVQDFGTAYSEVLSLLLAVNAQEIKREVYFTLPANTNVLFPASLGVTDFQEPQQIWERGDVGSVSVTSIKDGTPVELTFPDDPPGGRIELNGLVGDGSAQVPGWINRDWFTTRTGAHTATLNGSISMGNPNGTVIAQSAATAMFSQETFQPMWPVDEQPPGTVVPEVLGWWRWEDNALYFGGADAPRQLWIEYLASDTPPISGPIGLCNGRELKFLSHGTAAHFAPKRNLSMGPDLRSWAYGQSGQADGSGGLLRQLVNVIVKQQQQRPRRSGLYRRRRTQWPVITS